MYLPSKTQLDFVLPIGIDPGCVSGTAESTDRLTGIERVKQGPNDDLKSLTVTRLRPTYEPTLGQFWFFLKPHCFNLIRSWSRLSWMLEYITAKEDL
jgi:hypothetical protein